MAINDLGGLILEVGRIASWLQALGIVVALWIIFQAVSLWINLRRFRQVMKIKSDMDRIEGKLDKILKRH